MDNKIDITSTAVEKGIDAARNFLGRLIMPAVEETGLLIKEPATLFRFKNQIRMLNSAKAYCEKNNISPKTISFKLLCPLLDYSGIEEDDILQDKWAILLSNMVDSDQNIENHVFPYILSQLSRNEFLVLEKVFEEKQSRTVKLTHELNEFRKEISKIDVVEIKNKITEMETQIDTFHNTKPRVSTIDFWKVYTEKKEFENQLLSIKQRESVILRALRKPEIIPYESVQEYELSNLIRLGLVKEVKEFYANSQQLEIPYDSHKEYTYIDLDIDVESNVENILTELGELFIHACKEKVTNRN